MTIQQHRAHDCPTCGRRWACDGRCSQAVYPVKGKLQCPACYAALIARYGHAADIQAQLRGE